MNKQKVLAEARETAEVLLEDRGFYGAQNHIINAMKASSRDDPVWFWSRVWDALQEIKRGESK